jgi:hypothetical protein
MRLHFNPRFWTTSFLTAMGMTPLGCGGTVAGGAGDDGTNVETGAGNAGGVGGTSTSSGAGAPSGMWPGAGGLAGAGNAPTGGWAGQPLTGGAGGTGGTDGTGGTTTDACVSSAPLLDPDGHQTGYAYCDGQLHRMAQIACAPVRPSSCSYVDTDASPVPNDPAPGPEDAAAQDLADSEPWWRPPPPEPCRTNEDCTTRPAGHCTESCTCTYGCTTDADCSFYSICVCGSTRNQCVRAECTTDADCPGSRCGMYTICNQGHFACAEPEDLSCAVDGRPFLVAGQVRTAPVMRGSEWGATMSPLLDELSANDRQAIADSWRRIAALEHASVAAFARFALQLLALGAPPDLVERTQEAIGDEALHARLAFGLASAYGGEPAGPGPLDIAGALTSESLEQIVHLVVVEGCIGETIAAVRAAEAVALATDATVRAVLQQIAADETRHAELAWSFVAWALSKVSLDERDAMTRRMLATVHAMREAPVTPEPPLTLTERTLAGHGVLPRSMERAVRRRVLEEVVLPCMEALARAARVSMPTGERVTSKRPSAHGIMHDPFRHAISASASGSVRPHASPHE